MVAGLVVGGRGNAFGNSDDIVLALFVKPLLLRGADDVVWRRNTAPDVADDRLVEPIRLEWLDFHYHTPTATINFGLLLKG